MSTDFLEIKDNAYGILSADINASVTSITLGAGEGDRFPASGDFVVSCENEKMLCTARTDDTLTVTRGIHSTTAREHDQSTQVSLNVVSQHITDLNSAVNTLENATSSYATLTGSETLSNKTLTLPTISDLTNATHDHTDDASGGATLGPLTTHIADTTTHGTTGDVVGTSDSQTLTGKTIAKEDNTLTNENKFSAYMNTTQTNLASGGFTLVKYDTERFDTNNCYDTATGIFTAKVAGYYVFNWGAYIGSLGDQDKMLTVLYFNDVEFRRGSRSLQGVADSAASMGTAYMYLDVDDYVYVGAYHNYGSNRDIATSHPMNIFEGYLESV